MLRFVGLQARLHVGVRANFAAQAGDHRLAAKLYAAARTENRRAGMTWPRWELTRTLLERTRDHLTPVDYQ